MKCVFLRPALCVCPCSAYTMRFQHIPSFIITLSLYLGYVAADFHYGILTCAEAQGGSINSGFILASQTDTCLEAFDADKPGENIPPDSHLPTGVVCGHAVTIDLDALEWYSNETEAPIYGSCYKLGDGSQGIESNCSPPFAQCTWQDQYACSSHICS